VLTFVKRFVILFTVVLIKNLSTVEIPGIIQPRVG